MANYTLTYSDDHKGWTSFFSYFPEMMIGMNSNFYTFKGGNIWKHDVNPLRNNFYGVQYSSRVTAPFNPAPSDNLLFKTINIEGTHPWDALLVSDIQNTGFIESEYFIKQEGAWFSFVRNSSSSPAGSAEFVMRSANGIGRSTSIGGIPTATTVNFSVAPLVSIGSIISVGDDMYSAPPPYDSPVFVGLVTAIEVDLPNNINRVVIDTTVPGTTPIAGATDFFLSVKNSVAESHGVLGHYCTFDITNELSEEVLLFLVEAEVMKSYP